MQSLYLETLSSKNHVTFVEQPEEVNCELRCWLRYFLSAKKIQRIFRGWNSRRRFRNFLVNSGFKRHRETGTQTKAICPTLTLNQCFRNIIQGKASYESKMCVWRAVIELRRAYTAHSTDVILKSLIEAKGDFQRAHCLLGVREFYEESRKHPLSGKLRKLFLPSFTNPENDANETLRSAPTFDTFSDEHTAQYGSKSSNSSSNGRRIELIRALREKQRFLQKCELIEILNETVMLSYFSVNHTGNQLHTSNKRSFSKIPNKASVKLKYQTSQQEGK
jgi:hypothetical protein